MLEALVTPKEQIISISEEYTCQDAIQLLESEGLRCAPVLDATGQIFRGNIYRYHLYQQKFRYPEVDLATLPVTRFIKNTTKVVRTSDSILRLMFVMTDLPQIAVLSDQNTFIGIIYHRTLMQFFAQAWLSDHAKYVLEVTSSNQVGDLARITKLVTRYTDIITSITFEETQFRTPNKIFYVLPKSIDLVALNDLERLMARKGYPTKHYKIK